MDEARYFVDANVAMYAVGADHPLKQPCLAVLRAVARGDLVAVTDVEVHQEILHRYTALADRQRALEVSDLFMRAVPDVLAVTKADVSQAASLLGTLPGLPVRDAIHAAVIRRQGIQRVITADRHFDDVAGIERVDPARWR